jgi:hypothetical protein
MDTNLLHTYKSSQVPRLCLNHMLQQIILGLRYLMEQAIKWHQYLTMYLLVSHHCCPQVITATPGATEASGYVQHSQMWNLGSKAHAMLCSLTNSYVTHPTLPTSMHYSQMREREKKVGCPHLPYFLPHKTHFFSLKNISKNHHVS